MTKSLAGKVAIVTGSARNIGRAVALALAGEGAQVVVNARSSRDEIDEVAGTIRQAGGEAAAILADVSNPEQVDALFAETVRLYGRVDVLVNNAAVRREAPIAE